MKQKNINTKKKNFFLGAHLSIANGLHHALYRAKELDCDSLQIFTKNSNTWKEKDVSFKEMELFETAKKKTCIKNIVAHTSYLINLASPESKKRKMSCDALKNELVRSSKLNIPYIVLHPGSHMGRGEKHGIDQISENINKIFEQTPEVSAKLLLETTAGQGTNLGYTFEQLAAIIANITQKKRTGVCLDTSHVFAAGYDIRTQNSYLKTIDRFDSIIGLNNLKIIHLNDSKKGFKTKIDRHEHIGKGEIGIEAFRLIMNDKRFCHIPKIIETPKGKEENNWDKINLTLLKNLVKKT